MTRTRAALADAVRPFGPDGKLQTAHLPALWALADVLGVPADAPVAQVGLSDQDFADAAAQLGATVAQVRAVWEVESGGGWFTGVRTDILNRDGPGGFIDGPNLPKILFEAHHFDRLTDGRFRAKYPNLSSKTWNQRLYVGGVGEWIRLDQAMALDRAAALKSTSWGGAQIMGFNHVAAGFATVEAFVDAMKRSERDHLLAFVSFIRNSGLTAALRKVSNMHADCVPFARGYNGAGYARHDPPYNVRIARAHAKWSKA